MSSQYQFPTPGHAGMAPGLAQPQTYAQQAPMAPHTPMSGYAQMAPAMAYGPGIDMMRTPGAGYAPAGYQAQPTQPFFNFANDRFLRGLLIGAAATYLLTNEDVQRTVIKGAVRVWTTVQGGIEEAKERFRDAEAELHAAAENDG